MVANAVFPRRKAVAETAGKHAVALHRRHITTHDTTTGDDAMRTPTRGALAVVPLALSLALALAGCGGDSGGTKVASANGGTKSGAGSSSPSLSPDEMGVKFAQCLREHGLDVDDPEPGKGIRLDLKPGMDKATTDKAMEACRKYDPVQNGSATANPQGQEAMRKYAQCMRRNGVQDFPDPKGAGLQVDGSVMDDPDYKTADKKCRHFTGSGGTTHTESN
jgi:hypothetical protein